MKFLKHKSKQAKQNEKCYGYTVIKPCGDFDTGRVSICLVKGILMFGAAFGTVLSIVSAFDLHINLPLIAGAFLILSMLLSFMHYNRVIFNIGYPVAFLIFTFSILKNRSYVNSGFQAVVNQIRTDYTDYFLLNFTGEAYEAVGNRYLAMTCAFVYLGFFLIVLLNVAISNYMSIFFTVLLTFPFLQFGLYIEKMPSLVSVFLLLAVYAGVLFLKRSGHYSLSERREKDRAFTVRKNVYSYKGKGKVMGQLLGLTCIIVLAFSVVSYPIMNITLPGSEKTSALKASTDTVVKNLVQGGFSSLFNRYDATGGISGGKLGGVNRVKTDYETDLEVTFVPSSLKPLYLKAYTGAEYMGDRWEKPNYDESVAVKDEQRDEYENFTAALEANRLSDYSDRMQTDVMSGRIAVKNVGADSSYLYLPYYTKEETGVSAKADHSVIYGSSPAGLTYTGIYYPYTQNLSPLTYEDIILENHEEYGALPQYIKSYDRLCKEVYTEIPEEIRPELEKYTALIGEGADTMETVEKIHDYLAGNYSYSLNPGATPQGKDFVTWFLNHQKKGFCVHFATAGTLLCRAYGIPARYVEGYVIQTTDIASATLNEGEKVSDWFSGESELEKTGVVTVSVPDANAHAWTEIYIDNFGWIPVDFTPPSEEADISSDYSSFLQLFAGLFSAQQGGGDSAVTSEGQQGAVSHAIEKVLGGNSFILLPLGILVLVLVLAFFGWKLSVLLRPGIRRAISYRKGRYDEELSYDYRRLINLLKKRGLLNNPSQKPDAQVLPLEAFGLLESMITDEVSGKVRKEDVRKAGRLLEKGLYGKEQLTKTETDYVSGCITQCIKYIVRQAPVSIEK